MLLVTWSIPPGPGSDLRAHRLTQTGLCKWAMVRRFGFLKRTDRLASEHAKEIVCGAERVRRATEVLGRAKGPGVEEDRMHIHPFQLA